MGTCPPARNGAATHTRGRACCLVSLACVHAHPIVCVCVCEFCSWCTKVQGPSKCATPCRRHFPCVGEGCRTRRCAGEIDLAAIQFFGWPPLVILALGLPPSSTARPTLHSFKLAGQPRAVATPLRPARQPHRQLRIGYQVGGHLRPVAWACERATPGLLASSSPQLFSAHCFVRRLC